MSKKVSIITACLNSERTIVDCIRSVNEQSYPNIEHIFIDGGSVDKTCALIVRNGLREPKLENFSIPGVYNAFNRGIEVASGELVLFLNSDDMFAETDILQNMVAALSMNSKWVAVAGAVKIVAKSGGSRVVRLWTPTQYRGRFLAAVLHPAHPGFLCATSVLREIGGFRTDLLISSDYDFFLNFIDRGFIFLEFPKVAIIMRSGGLSSSGLSSWLKTFEEDVKILRCHQYLFVSAIIIATLKKLFKLRQVVFENKV